MQYCASFWNHRDEWYDPKLYRHTDCCFCTCFTNATQITRAVQRPEAPALLPVFPMTLMFCNAQRLMGMQRLVNGYLPYWFVLWVPVCVANRCCWADLKLSSSLFQSVCLSLCLPLRGLLYWGPPSQLRWTSTIEWYPDPGLLQNELFGSVDSASAALLPCITEKQFCSSPLVRFLILHPNSSFSILNWTLVPDIICNLCRIA